ncbi:unnamed protein product (macronuclear) [Paramecium tetraurelia]|uniref:Myb-like domain-containing protein n=1 Tax=Paramecium tetraurelia TaxID=5888 RepID=A0E8Q6_PARTE|nr:uncharacterized protein GSPATT00024402001 [Paramecium tetraurelia]CAK91673.1 unnamed protein product [Paramecium tetraurelia]|eukprot:XP_001459070.1 hypothetical protein (macronuclear) [Paramecium tetraurelia strain d4-2]
MKDINSQSTLTEQSNDILSEQQMVEPSMLIKYNDNMTIDIDDQGSVSRKMNMKNKKKKRQGRKSRDFTIQEDQKLLGLVLMFGPKFKTIQRKMSGRPLNILKNRYYRDLRYRWDEILGIEYAYLNEKKVDLSLDEIWKASPLDPDLSKIMMNMITQFQNVITKCLI